MNLWGTMSLCRASLIVAADGSRIKREIRPGGWNS